MKLFNIGIVLITFSLFFPVQADTEKIEGNVQRGEKLYLDYSCWSCHGYTGETGTGNRLNPLRFNLEGFISYVRRPPRPLLPHGVGMRMLAYDGPEVSDQNLGDIYTYLKSLPSGSPPIEEIPLLQPEY